MRIGILLATLVTATLTASCGLLRAPVKVVGGLVQGTAKVTKAAVDAPKEALDKRRARKEAEARNEESRGKSGRDAGPDLGNPPPVGGQAPSLDGSAGPPLPAGSGPVLPADGQPLDPDAPPPLPE